MLKKDAVVGGKYRFQNQSERLIYIGFNFSGNGHWHQFELEDNRGMVWCEIQTDDFCMIESLD